MKSKPKAQNPSRPFVLVNMAMTADGKIAIVSCGVPEPTRRVRSEFGRVKGLCELSPTFRGWTVDVLNVIRRLGKRRFLLTELYQMETELQLLHPQNRNIRPKIRQQLQVLRDIGLISFDGRGRYTLEA